MTRVYQGSHPDPAQLFEDTLEHPPPWIGANVETPNLTDRTLIGLGVAASASDAFYITPDDPDFTRLMWLIQYPITRKRWHNAPFDLRVLRRWEPDNVNVDDTAIMARLAGEPFADLPSLSWWVGIETRDDASIMEEHGVKRMDQLPIEVLARSCMNKARASLLLYDHLAPRVRPNMAYYEVERRLLHILDEISKHGIRLDQERRAQLEAYYTKEMSYYRVVAEGLGFDPGKDQQVGYILAKRGNFLPMTKSRRQLATDKDTLSGVEDPVAKLVLLYRHVEDMMSRYIMPLAGQERAYTTLHMDAVTGRVSSTGAGKTNPDRNLQNIPKKVEKHIAPTVRSMFLPDEDVFTQVDASQIQLRVLGYLARDYNMMSVFSERDEKGRPVGDIHTATSRAMGIERDFAKTFNFAMVFGADEYVIAPKIGTQDIRRTREYIDRWMYTYPQVAQWMLVQQEEGLRTGWVETLMGRRIRLPAEMDEKHVRNCAVNYPVQGTEAEIIKRMMVEMEPQLARTLLQIHDEELFNGVVKVPDELEHIAGFWTPLEVRQVERWG